jgi:hypothetical protein
MIQIWPNWHFLCRFLALLPTSNWNFLINGKVWDEKSINSFMLVRCPVQGRSSWKWRCPCYNWLSAALFSLTNLRCFVHLRFKFFFAVNFLVNFIANIFPLNWIEGKITQMWLADDEWYMIGWRGVYLISLFLGGLYLRLTCKRRKEELWK